MAHRIQMKLGVVPDTERAPDSPDTALHVEPRVGAQTRTKGHLFLLVTSRVPGQRARDATALIADSIRSEYYYDESAGIRVCLVKAIQVANKRLTHARERGALGNGPGPIGVALAVVRDNELYVCTVGPAEAYLNRTATDWTNGEPYEDWPVRLVATRSFVIDQAFKIVDIAMDLSGGAGAFRKNRLEQIFRDVRMGRFHPGNTLLAHELIGKLCLGVDPDRSPRWG